MDTTKTKTHAGPPLGSRWAQMWAYMWAEQLVIFWYMLPKVTHRLYNYLKYQGHAKVIFVAMIACAVQCTK